MKPIPLIVFNFDDRRERHQRSNNRNHRPMYKSVERKPRMMDDYQRIGSLNPGGMSIAINIVRKRSTGKVYVEKQVAHDDERGPTRVEAEIAALRQISPSGRKYNINTMLDCAAGRDAYHIILDYCDKGNLKEMISTTTERGIRYNEGFIWHVFISCMKALKFLHGGPVDRFGRQDPGWNTICHLDIKPENIYLQETGERYPRVVLGDFGGAVSNSDIICGKEVLYAAPAWTDGWEAPEMVAERNYGTKTDAWQLGGVIQTMCLLIARPDLAALASRQPCGSRYSQELNAVVKSLTEISMYRRSNAEDVLSIAEQGLRTATLRRGQP